MAQAPRFAESGSSPPRTRSEAYCQLAAAFAALAELEAKPDEPDEVTREEAAAITGEPSADTLYRRGIWEKARVKDWQKKPFYSRKILLDLMSRRAVKSVLR